MAEQMILQPIGNFLSSSILAIIPGILFSGIYLVLDSFNFDGHPPNKDILKREYDFIIVGGGSAGSVIANRLTENGFDQVLLLEAGGDETPISDTPGLVGYLQLSNMDWKYKVESSSRACLGMVDKMCLYPRGKVLGGSSVLDYMMYVRGNKKDYDGWAERGNEGWNFEQVLPYFKKSEGNKNPDIFKNKEYHSTKGELTVMYPPFSTPLADSFIKAGVSLGYGNCDINANNQTGFMTPQATMRDGSRCSTSKAFLRPIRKRRNLDIAKNAYVTKILIDPDTETAFGVNYYRSGAHFEVFARKEIILASGAFNSPQLLMLSGIGPKEHLESFKIPVIRDLPVGKNLQDHVGFGMTFVVDKPLSFLPHRYENLWAAFKYTFSKKGPLTSAGGSEGIAFVNSKFQDPDESYPDLQLHFVSGSPASDGGRNMRKMHHLSDEIWKSMFRPIAFKDSFTIIPTLLRPKSVGSVTLRSENPFVKPVINQNYLSSSDDIRRLVDGAKIAMKLTDSKAFKKIGARYHFVPIPLCPNERPPSDEYFECLIRYYTITSFHASGTVKMGLEDDPTSVVDPELRVHGIVGLRVADASIMPKIVSGDTNAPTIMIGEKASDLIKDFWNEEEKSYKDFIKYLQEIF